MYLVLICWVTHAPVFFLLFPPLNIYLFYHVEFLICHYESQPKIGHGCNSSSKEPETHCWMLSTSSLEVLKFSRPSLSSLTFFIINLVFSLTFSVISQRFPPFFSQNYLSFLWGRYSCLLHCYVWRAKDVLVYFQSWSFFCNQWFLSIQLWWIALSSCWFSRLLPSHYFLLLKSFIGIKINCPIFRCLDAILHAEHKGILEEMRAYYSSTCSKERHAGLSSMKLEEDDYNRQHISSESSDSTGNGEANSSRNDDIDKLLYLSNGWDLRKLFGRSPVDSILGSRLVTVVPLEYISWGLLMWFYRRNIRLLLE